MTTFNKYAKELKATGIPFNKEEFIEYTDRIINSLKMSNMRNNKGLVDIDTLMENPNEIMILIADTWGQELLKLFFVIMDRDISKIGKNDVTDRNRVLLFYQTVKQHYGASEKLDIIYNCLLIHVLEYEKVQILSAVKGKAISHTPLISTKYFGYKKNPYIYLDYVCRFTNTDSDRVGYTVTVPNLNQIGLASVLWGMTAEEARAYLQEQETGLLHTKVPKQEEDILLPFMLSDAGELIQQMFEGILTEDFKEHIDAINNKAGGKQGNFTYAFNSNPYTMILSEYKIMTMDTLLIELERIFGDNFKCTFLTDSRIAFSIPQGVSIEGDSPILKLIKPLDTVRYYS